MEIVNEHNGGEKKEEKDLPIIDKSNQDGLKKAQVKQDLIIPTGEPDDLVKLMNLNPQPKVPKNIGQSNIHGSNFRTENKSPSSKPNDPSKDTLPPIKSHKMVLGPSAGLGIGSYTGLGATGLGLIPNLDLKRHSKAQKEN